MTKKVKDRTEIAQVATISANGDTTIGEIIADAMDKVGKDGTITVEEAKTIETTLDVVEGMQFDKGYLSPYFVDERGDDGSRAGGRLHPDLREEDLAACRTCCRCSRRSPSPGKPLLIIAEEVEGEALATLVVNKLRGTLQVCAVKAPGFGDRRKAMLEDIAILTGGKFITRRPRHQARERQARGPRPRQARHGRQGKHHDRRGRGQGARTSRAAIAQIRRQIEETTSDYDREKLQERLAKLAGGVAVINVGAATETEMKEKKARVEDALHATRAAVEEGIVPGGGVALIRCQAALDEHEGRPATRRSAWRSSGGPAKRRCASS